MPKLITNFNKNVFINCPFDQRYASLFNAIIFTVFDVGFQPRCALEVSNAGQNRLHKILDIISECKYSIHDLSRTELDEHTKLPRFNMPFELGLDLGCKSFGLKRHRNKVSIVMDKNRYRFQKFISDISGQDIFAHKGKEKEIVLIIRNWLRQEIDPNKITIPGGNELFKRYQGFKKALPSLSNRFQWEYNRLPFHDYSYAVAVWIEENPF